MHTYITAGLLAVGAIAPASTSAAVTTTSTQQRALKFFFSHLVTNDELSKSSGEDDGNEGDEGNEVHAAVSH